MSLIQTHAPALLLLLAGATRAAERPPIRPAHPIADRQEADGRWEQDGRALEPTALCVLALLDEGSRYEALDAGLAWLCRRQDPRSGRIAESISDATGEHSLATRALAEGTYLGRVPCLLALATRRAVEYLLTRQLLDGSWALDSECPTGDAGTTAAALRALLVARELSYGDPRAIDRGLAWLAARAEPTSGVVEIEEAGGPSTARITARSALCRILAGHDARTDPLLSCQLAWLGAHPPSSEDPRYVVEASFACFQAGGASWTLWARGMQELLRERGLEGREAGERPIVELALEHVAFGVYFRSCRLSGAR